MYFKMFSSNEEKKIHKKIVRYSHKITAETGIEFCSNPTKYIIICNAGLSTGLKLEILVDTVSKYGSISDVVMIPGKSYCFLHLPNVEDSQNIFDAMNGQANLAQNNCIIYMSYCKEMPNFRNPWHADLPPGLIIYENFIDDNQEKLLMDCIVWDEEEELQALKHRQVKHYGFEFLYGSNNINRDKPLERKIPAECDMLWEKLANDSNIVFCPDQMTVNKYEPGEGIPPHVDTHSAFADPLISLSLGSDIVMEFRNPDRNLHRLINLPRKSLLIISGESRFGWTHGITPRVTDVIPLGNGLTVRTRSTRISFTFRVLGNGVCDCKFYSLCDTYKSNANNVKPNPSEIEQSNVHNVYNEIANHFSETRHSPWPQVEEFINDLPSNSILVDIGCGNGKYLNINDNIVKIGCDRSNELLKVCRQRNFSVFQCDCLAVPLKDQSVNACISIAVVHHLASKERRLKALTEMARILTPEGKGLIYVWAKNQEANNEKSSYLKQHNNKKEDSEALDHINVHSPLPIHANRTKFQHQDILVPWKLKEKNEINERTFLRYYHVFEEHELESLLNEISFIKIIKSYYDQGNWCVIFQRTI